MGAKRKKKQVSTTQARQVQTSEPVPRGIAEWTFNIIILIFATGTMAQPFVIPTSSMEDNLLVGTDYGHADQSAELEALDLVEQRGATGEIPPEVHALILAR